jgi:transcriptional regulator with XRE-family HTH domain
MTVQKNMRIKAARGLFGWSLATLSEKTGGELSTSRIANYESGIRDLKVPQAIILAKALRTTPAYLLGVEPLSGAVTENLSQSQAELFALMQQVAHLDESALHQATEVLKLLLKRKS